MSKVTIEFDPEKEGLTVDYMLAAGKFHSVITEADEKIRRKLKYDDLTDEQDAAYREAREMLWEAVKESGVEHLFFT